MAKSWCIQLESKCEALFKRFGALLACAVCALIPIRLSFTYCALVPLLVLWGATGRWRAISQDLRQPVVGSFAIFLSLTFITLWFGVDVARSLGNLCGLCLAALTIVVFSQVFKSRSDLIQALICLFVAQSVAAIHSILDAFSNSELPRLFVGTLTESGQLALVLPLLLAFILGVAKSPHDQVLIKPRYILAASALPLLVLALIFNLKRGPWIGCLIGCSIIFIRLRPRLTGIFFICALLVALTVPPVRNRLAEAQQNFFIAGGRSAIWEIGSEMIARYPLGIGFQNSPILRQFDHSIPENLKHFHSNYINVAVETGLMGLLAFLSWIYCILRSARKNSQRDPIALGIFAAILSSQIAGLLEYNFGDSEIKLLYFVLAGMLIGISKKLVATASS